MDFDTIFPLQSSEFIILLNFGSHLEKKNSFVTYKLIYIDKKIVFSISNKVHSDRSELDLSDETIRIQNFSLGRKL